MKKINEFLASLLLVSCAVCLLMGLLNYASFSHEKPIVRTFTYEIKTDAVGELTPKAKVQIDSIVNTIKHHEQTIKDRYDYVLEQKQYEEELITIGGIIVTIILSILGFFGYKSFKAIEEDAISNAKKIAESKTEEIATDMATHVTKNLNMKLSNELKKQQKKTLQEYKDKDIPTAVDDTVERKFREQVESHISNIEDNSSRIKSLEETVVSLQRQIDELTIINNSRRRTRLHLSEAPGLTPEQFSESINTTGNNTNNTNKA